VLFRSLTPANDLSHPIPEGLSVLRLAYHSKLSQVTFYAVQLSFLKSKSCSDHRVRVHLLLLVIVFRNWKAVWL